MKNKKKRKCTDCAWYNHISHKGCFNPDICKNQLLWVKEEEEYKEQFRYANEK